MADLNKYQFWTGGVPYDQAPKGYMWIGGMITFLLTALTASDDLPSANPNRRSQEFPLQCRDI